jgi:hypothetical protein
MYKTSGSEVLRRPAQLARDSRAFLLGVLQWGIEPLMMRHLACRSTERKCARMTDKKVWFIGRR